MSLHHAHRRKNHSQYGSVADTPTVLIRQIILYGYDMFPTSNLINGLSELDHQLAILLANSKTKLILSQSSQYSERENRIRQQNLSVVLPESHKCAIKRYIFCNLFRYIDV